MDINAIRDRIANLNRRQNKANDIWKPKDEHQVRLMPYPFGDDPFIELHFHYEVGDNPSILCPKANFGKECEVCDFCDLLKSWKDQNGSDKPEGLRKQDWELFKKVQPKARVFVPMIERGKEGDGAKFWGVTPNQAGELLKVCADGDRLADLGIDTSDTAAVAKRAIEVLISPDKGYDVTVTFAKPGEKGNSKSFAQVTITGKIRPTPLSKDKKALADLLGTVKNIKDVFPEVSSAEVSKMLRKFVGSAAPEAKPEGGVEKYGSNTKEDAKVSGTRTIDEAFGDMLGEDNA